jgi:hypothetical protein
MSASTKKFRRELKPGTVFRYSDKYSGKETRVYIVDVISEDYATSFTDDLDQRTLSLEVEIVSEPAPLPAPFDNWIDNPSPTPANNPPTPLPTPANNPPSPSPVPVPVTTENPHYRKLSPEPIDVIEAWELNFRLANVIKYVARHGRKPGADAVEDLVKARSYLTREINAIRGIKSWDI